MKEKHFFEQLNFAELDILNEIGNECWSPEEIDESLGFGRRTAKMHMRKLVLKGLLDWSGSDWKAGQPPNQKVFYNTRFFLTPIARSLMGDDGFHEKAFEYVLAHPGRPEGDPE